MAIYLMGHGLVAIPRQLFRNANVTSRLRRIQSQASRTHDKLNDASNELEELEAQLTQLRRRKNAVSRDHEDWIEEISAASSLPDYRSSTTPHVTAPQLPAVITDRYLADFSRKLLRARHKRIRFLNAWDQLVQSHIEVQALVDARASKRLEATSSSSYLERLRILTPYTRYLLHSKLIPFSRLSFGAIFALASISIIWSELIKFISPKLSIISLTILSHPKDKDPQITFRGQLLASLWLLYMSVTMLSSFSRVKIWGNRALVPRNTYLESAAWYSSQVAKLTVPLAYNFLTFLPKDVGHKTTFYAFLGVTINLTPLGTGFDYFFPIFILVPVSAALFNLYGRTTRFFGSSFIDEDDNEAGTSALGTGGWREGRDLINRELQSRARLGLEHRKNTTNQASNGARAEDRAVQPNSGTANRNSTNANTIAGEHYTDTPSQPQNQQPPHLPRTSTTDRLQSSRLAAATAAAEEEDENIFQGFAHRVRNTFETIDKPGWLDDLGKRPKWMRSASVSSEAGGGGQAAGRAVGGGGGGGEESGRAEVGRGLGKWFGGRPADGRVRL